MDKKVDLVVISEGTSMSPLIHSGDRLYIELSPFEKLKVNDVVIYKENKKLIAHRVLYKTANNIFTKGDNSPFNDSRISKNKVIGKVYKVERKGLTFDIRQLYLIQSTLYFKEITKINSQFKFNSIKYLFLKGLPLHLYYHGNVPQRIYFDCDLMISRQDIATVKKFMEKMGYKIIISSFNKKNNLSDKDKQEISFSKKVNGLPIIFDIHFAPVFLMTQIPKLGALYDDGLVSEMGESFMKRKRKITINDVDFNILEKKDLVMYLALHFFHHNYIGSFRLELLREIIKKERFSLKDYVHIAELINSYKVANFVYPSFMLLKRYYKTPVPDLFLKTLELSQHKILRSYAKTEIFYDESRFYGGISRFKTIFYLSPYPLARRLLIFLNPQVAYLIFSIILTKLLSSIVLFKLNKQELYNN